MFLVTIAVGCLQLLTTSSGSDRILPGVANAWKRNHTDLHAERGAYETGMGHPVLRVFTIIPQPPFNLSVVSTLANGRGHTPRMGGMMEQGA